MLNEYIIICKSVILYTQSEVHTRILDAYLIGIFSKQDIYSHYSDAMS